MIGKFSKYSALVQRSSALIPKVSIFTICYIIICLGVPCSKPLAGCIVGSVFHPSEVDKMSARNYWELSSKKKLLPRSGSSLEAVEPHPKKGP